MNKNARRSLLNLIQKSEWLIRLEKKDNVQRLKCCRHEDVLYSPDSRKLVIDALIKHLTPHVNKFDAIAISGYSMSMIAPIIAMLLNKSLILVRKRDEERASFHDVEGKTHQRYIIIDDLVSSGATFERIVSACKNFRCRFVGYALFKSCDIPDLQINRIVEEYKLKVRPVCFMNENIKIPY